MIYNKKFDFVDRFGRWYYGLTPKQFIKEQGGFCPWCNIHEIKYKGEKLKSQDLHELNKYFGE